MIWDGEDFSQKTVQELYETIRVNVDEEEQWKVFDFVEDFFLEELEIGDYINDINSYHLHMFDKHDVTTKKFDAIVEKAGKVDANYAAQIEGYCSLLGEYGKKFEAVCAIFCSPEKLRLSPDKYREKLEGSIPAIRMPRIPTSRNSRLMRQNCMR